jgi:hypothetical protein
MVLKFFRARSKPSHTPKERILEPHSDHPYNMNSSSMSIRLYTICGAPRSGAGTDVESELWNGASKLRSTGEGVESERRDEEILADTGC